MTTTNAKRGTAAKAKKPTSTKTAVATFPDPPDKPKADALAKMAIRPSVNAAAVLTEYTKPFGEQDIGALIEALADGVDELSTGDLSRCEAMLYGQAHALQAIFMNLARRATTQEYMKHWEAFLRMALKAQNQCRMTLETLATVKNPPVVFARQANINNGGQQQVNNGAAGGGTEKSRAAGAGNHTASHAGNFSPSRTAIKPAPQSELLDRSRQVQRPGATSADTCVASAGASAEPRD